MKGPSFRRNQGGQVIVEYILLMVVALSVSFMVQKWLKQTSFIQNFTIQPWTLLNGMVQCGTWAKCGIESPAPLHPSVTDRGLSLNPEDL